MNDNENRRPRLFFWLTILLLVLYALPLYTAPLAYWLSSGFAQDHFLYYAFVPFLGERHGLLDNLTRLLAPLVAAFAAVAFVGPRNFRRALIIIFLLIVAIALGLLDVSILTEERSLASLNAHEVAREITEPEVFLTLERYQEVLLALVATVLGLTLAARPEGVEL